MEFDEFGAAITSGPSKLHLFMERLYLAGMSIENVVARGFDFAHAGNYEASIQFVAASEVLKATRELGISREQQQKEQERMKS